MRRLTTEEKKRLLNFRLTESTRKKVLKWKPRDKTWDLFFSELDDIIKYFKKL